MTRPGTGHDDPQPWASDIVRRLSEHPSISRVTGLRDGTLAVPERGWPLLAAAVAVGGTHRLVVVVTATSREAERVADDLDIWLGRQRVELLPAWETLPLERVSPAVETMGRRHRVLHRLRERDPSLSAVVVPVRALLQKLAPSAGRVEPIVLRRGASGDPAELHEALVAFGYRPEPQVEHRGEVARRGSIVDVFPSTSDAPVRIDFFGDEIDRLAFFSVADQRTEDDLAEIVVYPAREMLADERLEERARLLVKKEPWAAEQWEKLAEGIFFDGMESWLPWLVDRDETVLDILDEEVLVLCCDPKKVAGRAAELMEDEKELVRTLASTWGASLDGETPMLHVSPSALRESRTSVLQVPPSPPDPSTPVTEISPPAPPRPDVPSFISELSASARRGWKVVVAADNEGTASALRRSFAREGVDTTDDPSEHAASIPLVAVAPLWCGVRLPDLQSLVVTEHELTGRRRPHRPPRERRRRAARHVDELTPGDIVVHDQHGVARYAGMVKRAMGGVERDYLLLEYRGGDRLYVPTDQIDLVRPYTGGDRPTLNRLGGGEWQRTKSKARAEAAAVAAELVDLYRRRAAATTRPTAPDTPWQREFEESFPYRETPDQLRAIEEVKADLESERPMDRLVCGDVGFGKTEVALRAAFKVVQDGGQVAVLVPTTLLAHQHTQTFRDRMSPWPVRVEMLSRFLTPAQQREVLEGLASGDVDVVIGTHRLLSEDVKFKKLELLVIDEEQRFGVEHKERLKKMRENLNVLTLSATPIPRTLEMSLVGIRDMSLLQTPPEGRQPILTYVGEFDERAVSEAIRREMLREGQVFYVHNRVRDIDRVASFVRDLVPEARVAVAHGQMDEGTLEQVVLDFWDHRYDVLVCTTIIESGIDMPTVNTLVVDRADLLGLGQLHQLRGRVGRGDQRAYAYIFVPSDRVLPESVYERLRTIGDETELGSGIRIAMRDLELRGAGNLLGFSQSGHLAAVGYDLYCRLVAEAVAELRGERKVEIEEVSIDLPRDAHLPVEYVPSEELRIEAYRKLASAEHHEEVDEIRAEWEDRYGPLPQQAQALLEIAHLRVECLRVGIREVVMPRSASRRVAKMSPVSLRESQQVRVKRLAPGSLYKAEAGELHVVVPPGADPASHLREFVSRLWPVDGEERRKGEHRR